MVRCKDCRAHRSIWRNRCESLGGMAAISTAWLISNATATFGQNRTQNNTILEQKLNSVFGTQAVDWQDVASIFELVGWGSRQPNDIRSAFEKSSYVIFIYDGDELAAYGRTMDDGRYYALLVDVVVGPSHQQLGLGREVVNYLKSKLLGYKFITLTAAPGKEEFYLKLGWQRQATSLIWPVSEEQKRLHASS